MKKLAISLVTYNGEQYLEACLLSIARQTFQDFQLVVFDNASYDDTLQLVKKYAPDATVIQSEKNGGFAAGHNAGIRAMESEYVCVLNQDIVLEPNYFQECISVMDRHSDGGSVTGLLIRVPSLTEMGPCDTIDSYGLSFSPFFSVKNYKQGTPVATAIKEEEVTGVPATAAIYRKKALEDIRDDDGWYFDEDFFMYKEDIDLALRLRLRGWKSWSLPETQGYHIRTTRPALFDRASEQINRWSYRNHFFILIKDVPARYWLRNGLFISVYEIAKFFYLLCCERSTLIALRDVWKMRKKMFLKRERIMQRIKCTRVCI